MSIPVFKISQCEKKEKGIDIRPDLAYNKGAKSERRQAVKPHRFQSSGVKEEKDEPTRRVNPNEKKSPKKSKEQSDELS